MNAMSRRSFIKSGLALTALPLASSLISCGSAVARPLVVGSAKTVVDYLADFAVLTGSEVVSHQFNRWFSSLHGDIHEVVRGVNDFMAGGGFTDFSSTVVYVNGPVLFYVARNQVGINVCGPTIVNDKFGALIEGPKVVGLALAAREWNNPDNISAANGLMPIRQNDFVGASFDKDMEKPFLAETPAGRLGIHYQNNQPGRGTVGVVASRPNGGELFGRDYTIEYAV